MWKKDKLQRILSVVKAIYFISSAVWLGGSARLSQRWSNVTHQEKEVRHARSSVLFTRHGETCTPTEPPDIQLPLPLTCSQDFAKRKSHLPPTKLSSILECNSQGGKQRKKKKKEAKNKQKAVLAARCRPCKLYMTTGSIDSLLFFSVS